MSAALRAHLEGEGRRALAAAADDIVDDAQRFAPVDTGRLRQSIGRGPVQGDRVEIHAKAPHAGFVEYGTRNMAAQPYLAPAAYRKRRVG